MGWLLGWIPAVSMSGLLSVIGIVVGTYYKAKVEKNVQHNLDRKLEELRSELRKEEEALRGEIRKRDDEIAAIRSGALAGLASRQAELDKRRIQAAEKAWASIVDVSKLKAALKFTAPLKMDALIEQGSKSDQQAEAIKKFGQMVWSSLGLDDIQNALPTAEKERPFLTPLAWALITTYRQVLWLPVSQLAAIKLGTGGEMLADPNPLVEMVKKALPEHIEYLDKYGVVGFSNIIDLLEQRVLSELVDNMESKASDAKNVERAAAILILAEDLKRANLPQPPPVGIKDTTA